MPNSEASPRAPATATPTVSYQSPPHVVSRSVTAKRAHMTRKICDMANVPLKSKTVDVAVFCLSLMGTNLADFLREAHRALKDVGILKIAEVRS
jgi:hypothetical protein